MAQGPAEDEFVLEDVVAEEPAPSIAASTAFKPVGEEEISFSNDFEPAPAVKLESEEDFSTISFDEPPPVVSPAAAVPPPMQTLEDIPEPSFAAAPVAPASAPAAPALETSAPAQVSLDEVQLKELLSRVSRDVIERIVWEVVPDLAETIIKEEIRKLKAGIA